MKIVSLANHSVKVNLNTIYMYLKINCGNTLFTGHRSQIKLTIHSTYAHIRIFKDTTVPGKAYLISDKIYHNTGN